jgi:meso-butanediol dehydrogenase / (S,S)-butanediol dehydrogenase / diacetyl reductase
VANAGRLSGRVVVVTGGGSGIGAAVARRCAADGAAVVIVGRTRERLDDVVRLLPAGSDVVPRVADVGDEQAVTALIDGVAAEHGRLDAVVHAVPARGDGAVDGLDTATWRAAVAVLDGVLFASRAALPHLRAVAGAVVTVVPTPGGRGRAAASATAAGAVALSEAMALEGAVDGVRANVVQVAPDLTPPRSAARDDDVAAAVAHLVGDDARAVTGSVLRADGGPGD